MEPASITLTPQQAAFIQSLVDTGRFANANEAIRASVHLLEDCLHQEEQAKETLRATLDKAFASGLSNRTPVEIWAAAEARYLARHA